MRVYVVNEWNGEPYEESCDWIDKIFINEEKAKQYVFNKNKKEEKKKMKEWQYRHQWSMEEHDIYDTKEEKENQE